MSSTAWAIAIPAATAISVAALSALAAYLASKRDRRRTLYSQAVKAAVAWEEMLFRVRRRGEGEDRDLIDRFHTLQDDIAYHRAWVGSESRYLARSYERLVVAAKEETAELIQQAWADPLRPTPGNALPDDKFPNITTHAAAFLQDLRSHLSPWLWRKLALVWRNRKEDVDAG